MALLLLAGLAEGVGVATVLPVLELAGGGADPTDRFGRAALAAFLRIGVRPTLGALLALVVVAVALKSLLRFLAMGEVVNTVARVAEDLRLRVLRAVMAARWSHFTGTPTGHVANALSIEALRAASAYRNACNALAALIQIAVYCVLAMLLSWKLALIAGACGLAIAALLAGRMRGSRRSGAEYSQMLRSLAGRVTDLVQSIKAVKSMGRDRTFLGWLESQSGHIARAESALLKRHDTLVALQEPLLALALAVAVFASATWGAQPLPSLLLTAFLLYRVVGRIQVVQSEAHAVAVAEGSFWLLIEQASVAEAAREPDGGTLAPPPLASGITLEDVSFERDGRTVLDSVSLHIPAGSFVALTGPSGSGKTTLADLLIGLQQPSAGRILVDGVPLSLLDPLAWRGRVGHVPQDTVLLHETIAANVALGLVDVSPEEVERALRAAGAWEFVSRMPAGVDSVVGERGLKLSGGERQRIAIARALIARPTLLILDEATAGLDRATEAGVWETVRALRGTVTIVAVAHQPAAADAADLVYQLGIGGTIRPAVPAAAY